MTDYLCIHFSSSTYLFKASDALTALRIPFQIMRQSKNLSEKGCERCILINRLYRARALSAIREVGCGYVTIGEGTDI